MPAEKFVTPIAECMYASLQQPNVSKDGSYPDSFQIVVILDATNKAHHELLDHVKNLHAEGVGLKREHPKLKETGHYPIKPHKDADENVVPDRYEIRFKTLADYADQIPTFDSEGNKIFREKNFIANGSRVRVSWGYKFYDKAGNKGVSLFLHGVQVIELIEWKGFTSEALGFKKEEGFVDESKTEAEKEAEEFIENYPGSDIDNEYEAGKADQDLPF